MTTATCADGRTVLLSAKASEYAFFESLGGRSDEAMRRASRDMLRRDARKLGFDPAEIEAAVDAAIASARRAA
jgi:hypothetical protein